LAGGRLQINAFLGRTFFGETYAAQDRSSGQPVAIRVLAEPLARDPQAAQRLGQLAAGLGKLEHKNLCRPLEAGNEAGILWLSSELVDGQSLRSLLAKKRAAGSPAF